MGVGGEECKNITPPFAALTSAALDSILPLEPPGGASSCTFNHFMLPPPEQRPFPTKKIYTHIYTHTHSLSVPPHPAHPLNNPEADTAFKELTNLTRLGVIGKGH